MSRLNRCAGLLMGAALALSVGACAEGLEQPEPTPTAKIHDGLTYSFGSETLCVPENQTNTLSCDASSSQDFPHYFPAVMVTVTPFLIDTHEVTNDQYNLCVAYGDCSRASTEACNAVSGAQASNDYCDNRLFKDFPVVSVTWDEATEYCKAQGMRLPTEFEWERVASGNPAEFPIGRTYPVDGLANLSECKSADVVLSTVACRGDLLMDSATVPGSDRVTESGQSIAHLFGNAAEWTSGSFDDAMTCLQTETGKIVTPCGSGAFAGSNDNCPECTDYVPTAGDLDPPGPGATECFSICFGEDRQSIKCERLAPADTVFDPAALLSEGGDLRTVRGGHVQATDSTSCSLRSTARFGKSRTKRFSHVGFRCACDDRNKDGTCDAL